VERLKTRRIVTTHPRKRAGSSRIDCGRRLPDSGCAGKLLLENGRAPYHRPADPEALIAHT
jgi:hypothetical protein